MSDDRHDAISTRAYQIWEKEGRPHGRDEHHWHEASRGTEDATDGALTTDTAGMAVESGADEAPGKPVKKPRAAKAKPVAVDDTATKSVKAAKPRAPKSAR